MPIKKLKTYLDNNHVRYLVITHSTAYTAQETAQVTHISGKEVAKTIMVNADGKDGRMIMVVLPASKRIDFNLFKQATGEQTPELATEEEFKDVFPDCEVGAMPPFGNLYKIDVLVDKALTQDKEIVFNAGNHHELVKMEFEDYNKLVHPRILELTRS